MPDLVEQILEVLGDAWLPQIYRQRVLKMRSRSYHFPTAGRNSTVEIQHTLLGIELKIGRHRLLCPDVATARYLAVFARVGCKAVAIPYDITRISRVADELERSWHRMLLLAAKLAAGRSLAFRTRLRNRLIAKVSAELSEAGAGPSLPDFRQRTKQRRR